jgi:hypothetical protein
MKRIGRLVGGRGAAERILDVPPAYTEPVPPARQLSLQRSEAIPPRFGFDLIDAGFEVLDPAEQVVGHVDEAPPLGGVRRNAFEPVRDFLQLDSLAGEDGRELIKIDVGDLGGVDGL